MKTVIIYTGALRSIEKCWANHRWFIHRHFPEARFFFAFEDDEDAHKISIPEKAMEPFRLDYRKAKQPEMVIPHSCPSEWTPGKPYMHEPYHISVEPAAVMGQLWMLREGWRLYQEANDPADLVIRIRPDLWFHSFTKPHGLPTREKIPIVLESGAWVNPPETASVVWTPWWGRFGGINDRFAILGSQAAEQYFTTYDKIPMLISAGCPLHPESLVAASMRHGLISICDDMKAEFSTLRKSGEMRPPEITTIDLAHFKV